MTMRFEFATAARIVFGNGEVREAARAAANMGDNALLVTGLPPQQVGRLAEDLYAMDVNICPFTIEGEPTVDMVRQGNQYARDQRCNLVIGIGGGSAIDTGKAIAVMLTNSGEPLDYLEIIGKGMPLVQPSAPFIAIPTTAGTGSEVTRNAVLASPEHGIKASLRSSFMLPRLAVVDPELTLELPPALTASTGLDALTQLIEPFVSVRANPMTDMYCIEGMRRASTALLRAFLDGSDRQARADMSMASLLGGLALANAGLGAVHGFAAPVGGMFNAPHGSVCAALLPHAMDVNIRALRDRGNQEESLDRYQRVARILTNKDDATPEHAVEWIAEICQKLEIPPLSTLGIQEQAVPILVKLASQASSMKANPVALTEDELKDVLTRAM